MNIDFPKITEREMESVKDYLGESRFMLMMMTPAHSEFQKRYHALKDAIKSFKDLGFKDGETTLLTWAAHDNQDVHEMFRILKIMDYGAVIQYEEKYGELEGMSMEEKMNYLDEIDFDCWKELTNE